MLYVHEGPKTLGVQRNKTLEFEEGMCVSDEPGFYKDNEFGLRIENVIMVVQHPKHDKSLMFENLTLLPYARELIDLELLPEEYVAYVNKFHK